MLIGEGLRLMVIGMSTVFVFLIIMVFVMNFSAVIIKFINKYFPEKEETQKSHIKKAIESHEDIAVAIAAVKEYTK